MGQPVEGNRLVGARFCVRSTAELVIFAAAAGFSWSIIRDRLLSSFGRRISKMELDELYQGYSCLTKDTASAVLKYYDLCELVSESGRNAGRSGSTNEEREGWR